MLRSTPESQPAKGALRTLSGLARRVAPRASIFEAAQGITSGFNARVRRAITTIFPGRFPGCIR